MEELNPNHPMTRKMHTEWHKLCALLVYKFGRGLEVQITSTDIVEFSRSGVCNITVESPAEDILRLRLVDDFTAAQLARREGGLPH
jgi:hypothetical protein